MPINSQRDKHMLKIFSDVPITVYNLTDVNLEANMWWGDGLGQGV